MSTMDGLWQKVVTDELSPGDFPLLLGYYTYSIILIMIKSIVIKNVSFHNHLNERTGEIAIDTRQLLRKNKYQSSKVEFVR